GHSWTPYASKATCGARSEGSGWTRSLVRRVRRENSPNVGFAPRGVSAAVQPLCSRDGVETVETPTALGRCQKPQENRHLQRAHSNYQLSPNAAIRDTSPSAKGGT